MIYWHFRTMNNSTEFGSNRSDDQTLSGRRPRTVTNCLRTVTAADSLTPSYRIVVRCSSCCRQRKRGKMIWRRKYGPDRLCSLQRSVSRPTTSHHRNNNSLKTDGSWSQKCPTFNRLHAVARWVDELDWQIGRQSLLLFIVIDFRHSRRRATPANSLCIRHLGAVDHRSLISETEIHRRHFPAPCWQMTRRRSCESSFCRRSEM